MKLNMPFASCFEPHYESEAKGKLVFIHMHLDLFHSNSEIAYYIAMRLWSHRSHSSTLQKDFSLPCFHSIPFHSNVILRLFSSLQFKSMFFSASENQVSL